MRADRPSYQSPRGDRDVGDPDIQRAKEANVLRYAARVAAGQPVFEGAISHIHAALWY